MEKMNSKQMSTSDMLKMLSMFKVSNHNIPAIVNKLEERGLHVLAKKRFGLEHIAKIEGMDNKAQNLCSSTVSTRLQYTKWGGFLMVV